MADGFPGFPAEGMQFFRDLDKNNDREWFQPRKSIYELNVKLPMEQLVGEVNSAMLKFAPQYITEPRRAVYRIYRDTRFSKNKLPYKDHLGATFSRMGMEKHISAGFYFGVGPKQIEVAGGLYAPGPDEMRAIRNFLLDRHEEFAALVTSKTLRKLVGELWGEKLTRAPKGFLPGHPADEFIRLKQWVFYDTRIDPALAMTPKLLKEIVKRFEALTPFVEFLNGPLRRSLKTSPVAEYEL